MPPAKRDCSAIARDVSVLEGKQQEAAFTVDRAQERLQRLTAKLLEEKQALKKAQDEADEDQAEESRRQRQQADKAAAKTKDLEAQLAAAQKTATEAEARMEQLTSMAKAKREAEEKLEVMKARLDARQDLPKTDNQAFTSSSCKKPASPARGPRGRSPVSISPDPEQTRLPAKWFGHGDVSHQHILFEWTSRSDGLKGWRCKACKTWADDSHCCTERHVNKQWHLLTNQGIDLGEDKPPAGSREPTPRDDDSQDWGQWSNKTWHSDGSKSLRLTSRDHAGRKRGDRLAESHQSTD